MLSDELDPPPPQAVKRRDKKPLIKIFCIAFYQLTYSNRIVLQNLMIGVIVFFKWCARRKRPSWVALSNRFLWRAVRQGHVVHWFVWRLLVPALADSVAADDGL